MCVAVLLAACGGTETTQSPPAETGNAPAEVPAPKSPVLLASGPVKRYGILVLPANAIPHYEGVYRAGDFTITVRYTEESVVIPPDWVDRRCGTLPLRFTSGYGVFHYVYAAEEGWSAFFEIPENYGEDCPFIQRFVQRLRYFKSVSEATGTVPFPAVVETS